MASLKRKGFGQVELNQLAGGRVSARIVDQVEADSSLGSILEQGRFVRINGTGTKLLKPFATGATAEATAVGPFLMIYNEEHFYDERDFMHKDYAMKQDELYDTMVPRCFALDELDKFTTNTLGVANTGKDITVDTGVDVSAAEYLYINDDGFLCATEKEGSPKFSILKGVGYKTGTMATTLADEQDAVKVMLIDAQ